MIDGIHVFNKALWQLPGRGISKVSSCIHFEMCHLSRLTVNQVLAKMLIIAVLYVERGANFIIVYIQKLAIRFSHPGLILF